MGQEEREEKQVTRQERRQNRKDNGRKMRVHGRSTRDLIRIYGEKRRAKKDES